MNCTIRLTRTDIADIIAEKYGVPYGCVTVTTEKDTIGYGPSEQEVSVPVAMVTMTREQMEEKGWA